MESCILKKTSIHTKTKEMKVNPDYFTGKVLLQELSSIVKSQEQKIYHVTFQNGARTKLHTHTGGQILIVTKGRGSLHMYSKSGNNKSKFSIKKTDKINLFEGDIVYIPAKKLHTHGSIDKKQVFSHIAINANASIYKDAKTTWYESDFKTKVTKILE
jgi:quercetin dioxygenase-like cupin family protein